MRSLYARLLLAIVAVTAVALISVGLVSTRTTRFEFAHLNRTPQMDVPNSLVLRVEQWYARHHSWTNVSAVLHSSRGTVLLFSPAGSFIAASVPGVRQASITRDVVPTLHLTVSRSGNPADEEQLVLRNPPSAAIRDHTGRPRAILFIAPMNVPSEPTAVTNITRELWIAIAVALLAAFGAALLLARQILAPVSALSEATAAMQAGDLSRRIPVRGPAEIAELARRFNALAAHLERSESLRKRMISDVAHELRSPLTNVRGTIEAIEDGHLPATAATLQSLSEEAAFLEHLVNDLQELALGDAGQLRLDMKEVALRDCIVAAVESAASAARAKNVRLVMEPGDSPRVRGDAARLRQIVGNLLSNAIRLAPDNSSVTVSIASENGAARGSVRDEGPGIKPEELDAIFERFYRADESRSRAGGGAGLGLAIAKQLVEAHGGTVHATNNANTPGATLSFTLPIVSW